MESFSQSSWDLIIYTFEFASEGFSEASPHSISLFFCLFSISFLISQFHIFQLIFVSLFSLYVLSLSSPLWISYTVSLVFFFSACIAKPFCIFLPLPYTMMIGSTRRRLGSPMFNRSNCSKVFVIKVQKEIWLFL